MDEIVLLTIIIKSITKKIVDDILNIIIWYYRKKLVIKKPDTWARKNERQYKMFCYSTCNMICFLTIS